MADQSQALPVRAEVVEKTLLDQIVEEQAHVASRYMPILTPKQFTEREKLIAELRAMLVEGVDYGVIPGTEKPTLLLPGAQKVCAYFGYVPRYATDAVIEDWSGSHGEPLFYYRLTCELEKDGKAVGRGLGSCNSWESKYRYRWVSQEEAKRFSGWKEFPTRGGAIREFDFAVTKAETGGKYGKPASYWARFQDEIEAGTARKVQKTDSKGVERDAWEIDAMQYRVPNDNFPDTINTVLKMARKRAYVDATLSATGLSQYFTQDLEDLQDIDTGGHRVGTQVAADAVANRKIAELGKNQPQIDPADKEFQPKLEALQSGAQRAVDECFDWLQNQLIANGGPAAEKAYLARMKHLGEQVGNRQPKMSELRGAALVEWGEVKRLRAERAKRLKDQEESAFGVAK